MTMAIKVTQMPAWRPSLQSMTRDLSVIGLLGVVEPFRVRRAIAENIKYEPIKTK